MDRSTDFLVVGSGIAALSYALQVADRGKVVVVSKGEATETNTRYAQGGIAAVLHSTSDLEKHIEDTMRAGSGLNDPEVVRLVASSAAQAIEDLTGWGVEFDRKKEDGAYELAREGGHSAHRILHHKDSTGLEIQNRLARAAAAHPNIKLLEHHFAVDLLTQHHLGKLVKKGMPGTECYGAYVLDIETGRIDTYLSKVTVLATGGIGNVYYTTTNPPPATGDGIAMVHRARGVLADMEFVQFHPTALYNPSERPSFLISEAVRGFGAVLRTQDGAEFMHKYHPMGSLAPRDIVARSIDNELKSRGEEFVWLDITHRSAAEVRDAFPMIYQKCLSIGIDITKDMIPVQPAAHYLCGGVVVDTHGESSIERLYVVGESARTGLHGANRLASNSLLEAVVYATRAAEHSRARIDSLTLEEGIPAWNNDGVTSPEERVLITQSVKELQQIMSYYVGIVRSNVRLERALDRVGILHTETEHLYRRSTVSVELCQLRNMIATAYLIIKQAYARRHSVGLHYSLDYPIQNP